MFALYYKLKRLIWQYMCMIWLNKYSIVYFINYIPVNTHQTHFSIIKQVWLKYNNIEYSFSAAKYMYMQL